MAEVLQTVLFRAAPTWRGAWRGAWLGALLSILLGVPPGGTPCAAAKAPLLTRQGVVEFKPGAGEASVPPRFHLARHSFEFQQKYLPDVSDNCLVSNITFPSPVKTPHENNNTVHCEYFQPKREGRAPGVVVLHILGGDFELSRMFCHAMVQRGVASMLLKMPYYGPRRQPGVNRRMITLDPRETADGMTQAVLDIRRAVAWLGEQPEVDDQRLGVFGISLGGITGALATAAEPRLRNVCLLLAGGDVGQIAWESPAASKVKQYWLARGGTKQEFLKLLEPVDPARYAKQFPGRRVLLLNARQDEVIPKKCTLALWEAMGQPEIVWFEGGHYSVAIHFLSALQRVKNFFGAAEKAKD